LTCAQCQAQQRRAAAARSAARTLRCSDSLMCDSRLVSTCRRTTPGLQRRCEGRAVLAAAGGRAPAGPAVSLTFRAPRPVPAPAAPPASPAAPLCLQASLESQAACHARSGDEHALSRPVQALTCDQLAVVVLQDGALGCHAPQGTPGRICCLGRRGKCPMESARRDSTSCLSRWRCALGKSRIRAALTPPDPKRFEIGWRSWKSGTR